MTITFFTIKKFVHGVKHHVTDYSGRRRGCGGHLVNINWKICMKIIIDIIYFSMPYESWLLAYI